MRWLVTGAGGLLGYDVMAELSGEHAVGLHHKELDITDPSALRAAFAMHRPDIVINCAAYTAVEDAESHEALALHINGGGPRHLAEVCAEYRTRLVHLSTDYVFPGDADTPYAEDHETGPGTAYGRSKLAGEQAVLELLPELGTVVRTAWLYGENGGSFVTKMIELAEVRDTIDVVNDQFGQPTWSADVAAQIVSLGRIDGARGVFHATNAGMASWFDYAREVFTLIGADPARVRPMEGALYPTVVPRPRYTVLGHDRWSTVGMRPLRDWRLALREAMPRLR